MGRTHSTYQGLKVSGAVRRIGNLAGRTRGEWREAKRLNNHAYAGELARKSAAPRLVRKADAVSAELQAIALEDAIADALSIGPVIDNVEAREEARRIVRKAGPVSWDDAVREALNSLR